VDIEISDETAAELGIEIEASTADQKSSETADKTVETQSGGSGGSQKLSTSV
jgi:hypothetical protein